MSRLLSTSLSAAPRFLPHANRPLIPSVRAIAHCQQLHFHTRAPTLPSPSPYTVTNRLQSTSTDSNPPKKPRNSLFWVLANVAAAGVLYVLVDELRRPAGDVKQDTAGEKDGEGEDTPHLFPTSLVSVVFVLGGPGAGKGTQCANLVRDHGFLHLSAGDLLRAEQSRPGSPHGAMIDKYIREGLVVPMEVTIALLKRAMADALDGEGKGRFLVDGFPRKQDQADAFERDVAQAKAVLYFECPEKELERRLLGRGVTSGRADDNIESIRKRFATFTTTSYPVIANYAARGKVINVSCLGDPSSVYDRTQRALADVGIIEYTSTTSPTSPTSPAPPAAPSPNPAPPASKPAPTKEDIPRSLLLPVAAGILWGVGWVVAGRA
ncbi:ADK-domain-containing protein [Gonapodya prolifera JEL478]|uniref:Uridylate kinase n=1 Tax=Gonapodya prolifera (strain JEL478) TaxID=1344416 RepID=A0A139A463_GONPJ|nr:ADK-domain-containing protein [Gonapodya prolifera JEL478]|eukprot:KXS11504.1 ADK-domain-containing protein [Gonapodya prolifera JEL478]